MLAGGGVGGGGVFLLYCKHVTENNENIFKENVWINKYISLRMHILGQKL